MFRVPGKYPQKAILRLESKSLEALASLGPLQSRKSVSSITVVAGPVIEAYNVAHPGNESSYTIEDSFQILPYSTLQIVLMTNPPARTPYLVPVNTIDFATLTALDVADLVVRNINEWVAAYRGSNPQVASLTARVVVDGFGTHVYISMPWGMNGMTNGLSHAGPGTNFVEVVPGFDNPLIAGIVGPRRHILPIRPRYDGGYYYGDVNIG